VAGAEAVTWVEEAAWEVVVAWSISKGVCTGAFCWDGGFGEVVAIGASRLLSGLSASSNDFTSASKRDSTCWQPDKARTSHTVLIREKRSITESWPEIQSKICDLY
jgi:hypothetical protein